VCGGNTSTELRVLVRTDAKHPPNGGWGAAVAGATVAAAALSLYNSRTMNGVRWPGV
jgi:hypothetical protein